MDSGKISKFLAIFLILGFIPLTASISQVDVLVVDDGHNLTNYDEAQYTEGMFRDNYLNSLESIEGVDAEIETTDYGSSGELGPPVDVLKQYDAVVWYTLSDRDTGDLDNIEETLKPEDQDRISDYLENHSGTFLLTGHRISYDISQAQSEDVNFYRKFLGVESNPGSYYRGKIDNDGKFKGGAFDEVQLRDMTYDERNNLALAATDTRIFDSGEVFNIDTTFETFDDFRTVSDICNNRLDGESEENCLNKQESLRWMNNIPKGSPSGDVTVKNVNSNGQTDTSSLRVGYDGGGEGRVLLVGATTLKSNKDSSEIKSAVLDNGRSLREVKTVHNGNYTTKVFVVKNPATESAVTLNSTNSTHMSAVAVSLSDAARGITFGPVKTNRTNQSTTSTTIENEEGEKIIDFVSSSKELEAAENGHESMDNVDVGNQNAVLHGFKEEGTGTQEMEYTSGDNFTQITLNIERDTTDAEYVIEQDNEQLTNNGNPDEYATALSTFFNNSYRSTVASFGYESIERNKSQKKLMQETIRYLTGPVANQTKATAVGNTDLPYTEVNESRYTSKYIDLSSRGMNNFNPSKIANARYFYSNSSLGFEPALEYPIEYENRFTEDWGIYTEDGGEYSFTGNCGSKFGSKALKLSGSEENDGFLGYEQGDDLVSVTSPSFNASSVSNLTVEFWAKAPDSESNCVAPASGDTLSIFYEDSSGSYQYIESLSPSAYRGGWARYEKKLPEDKLHSDMKIGIQKDYTDYSDAWLIDGFSVHQKLGVTGNSHSNTEQVEKDLIDLTDIKPNLSATDKATGVNVTIGAQFKDSSSQGYWGDMEKTWVKVDTQAPDVPEGTTSFSSNREYTNEEVVSFTYSNRIGSEYRANYIRFSCSPSSGEWSRWKKLDRNEQTETLSFDVTNASAGCSTNEGSRTVYGQFRDYAGNIPTRKVQDEVIYDVTPPNYQGETPENRSAIQSGEEVYINASDNRALDNTDIVYFNGSENISFTPNQKFDPGFSSEGLTTGVAYIFDKASNLNKVPVAFDLDDTPPVSNVTPQNKEVPTNNSVVNSDFDMIINISDRNFDKVEIEVGGTNNTVNSKDVIFSPGWSEGASQDLVLWMRDRAGNREMANYTYDVDDTPPVKGAVKEKNQSYILNSTRLGYNFSDSITRVVSTSVSENKVGLNAYDLGVETSWITEGTHYLQVNASDVLNKRKLNFTYIVDETPPETDVYFPDYSSGTWTNTSVSADINATDNMNMSTISYCKRSAGGSCNLNSESQPDENVSETISCVQGETCRKVLEYNSRDSAGNKLSSNPLVSSEIKIDKEAPQINNLRPSGITTSGNITISAEIYDAGSGISTTQITIYNSSDPSQVYEQGSMNQGSGAWTYEWDSEKQITQSGDVTVNISASDDFNYKKSKESQFRVDNQRVSVRIDTPFQEIVNEDFRLNTTAVRPGSEYVSSHNYSINQSSTVFYSNNTTSINKDTHRYDLIFDTSNIQNDGNYTLNTSAEGGGDEYATTDTWFYLDREAPEAKITSNLNDTWQTGEINVDFKAYDTVKNGSLKYKYRDNEGSWAEESLTYGQGSFTFPTSERCDDDSEADCQIKIVAEDEAGNINTSLVSFKVDNSRPSVTIDSPEAFSWQKGDFQVGKTIKDEEAENSDQGLTCSYMVNNSGNYQASATCNSSISIDIPQDYEDEEFGVSVKASNPAGLETEVDRTFRIDTNPPQVTQSYPRPDSGTIINGEESIKFYFDTDFSEIVYQVLDDGNNRQSVTDGGSYEPQWSSSGERTLDLELNDTAGNFKENSYTYTFDNKNPELNVTSLNRPYDDFFGEVRVYSGQSLKFNASVIENIRMDRAVLEVNETGTVSEYSLAAPEDLKNGTWKTDLPTETSGYYNFTSLKLVDEAGNTVTNTSLEGYRVVNYSQTVEMGGLSEINAGQENKFNFTVNFNRTTGERNIDLFIPPSSPDSLKDPYYDLNSLTCEASGCNVTATDRKIDLNYSGDRQQINLTGNIYAETEDNDKDSPFISEIAGNTRESSALLKTPQLEVGNLSCKDACEVDQFANFTLQADALNNQTTDNTGKAFDVTLGVSSNSSRNPVEKTKIEGNILSGESLTESFENLSFEQAGTFEVQTVIEDVTQDYSNSASIDIKVRDILKPKVNDTRPSTDRININDSIQLEANITDNTEVKSANLTLKLPNTTERTLEMSRARDSIFFSSFENTSEQGVYNITEVEALDQAGNRRTVRPYETFKVTQLRLDVNVSETNISNNEAVNFSLNITGNSSQISDVVINATTPKDDREINTYEEVTTNDTLRFAGFKNSGNYSFNVTVNSDFSVTNQTEDVFVKFGSSNISSLSGQNDTILIPQGGDVDVPWEVSTENGSIRDISLEFDSSDSSTVSAPQTTKDIGNVTAEKGSKTSDFTFSPENIGNTSVNMTVSPRNGTESSKEVKVWVNQTDQIAPSIKEHQVDDSILNLGENQSFTAEVEENSVIRNLTLNIESNETGNTWKKEMKRTGKGTFAYNFSGSDRVGFYNYSITAYDISGNNMTSEGNYTVSDNYQIQVSHSKETYVKGDSPQFDIEIKDMSGEEVQNYDAEVTLDKGSQTETLGNGFVEEASTTIFSSDPPSPSDSAGNLPITYDLEVNVTKGQNQGLYTEGIDVTRRLDIRDFEVVEEFIPEGGNFTVQGRWVEPGGYEVDGLSPSFLSCRNCEEQFKQFNKINSSTNLRRQTFSVPNGTDSVLVQAVVSNAYGNSESQLTNDPAPALDVEIGGQGTELNGTNGPGGGFGAIGGGGPTMTITRISPNITIGSEVENVNLSVTTDLSAQCRYTPNPSGDSFPYSSATEFTNTGGNLHFSEIDLGEASSPFSYSVLCSADGVNQSASLFFSRNSTQVSNFRPSLPRSITRGNNSIRQLSNGTGTFRLFNEGGEPIDVEFGIESDCCEAWVQRNGERIDRARIQSQEQEEFDIFVNAPLSAKRGVHTLDLSIKGKNTTVNRSVTFDVERSEVVQRYYDLRNRAGILNSSIERYNIAGIDTSQERKLFGELEEELRLANNSIQEDDRETLVNALNEAESKAEKIDKGLQDDSLKKYVLLNWWKWATGFVVTYMAFFLIVMVAIPYYRIRTELTRINGELDRQIEARKKGEKQYFKRQIDKDTFNKMMQKRQNKVLELRGEKEDLKEELDSFLWSQLTLENYIKAPSKGMKELEKWWAANRRARQNLNKDGSEDGSE